MTLTDAAGEVGTTRANPFGFYRFTDVPAFEVYTVGATHKPYIFARQIQNVTENVGQVNLIAIEP